MKRRFRENIPGLALLLSIPVLNVAYPLLNHGEGTVHSLVTAWDEAIPFVPAFSVPYMLWYFFVFGTLVSLCFSDRRIYLRTLLAVDIGLLVCYSFFWAFQTTVPRPDLSGDDFFHQLTRWVYAADNPYNCFPSIHVLTSWLAARGLWQSAVRSRLVKLLGAAFSFAIIASTLLIKQHTILDAAAGIALAELVYYAGGRLTQSVKQVYGYGNRNDSIGR